MSEPVFADGSVYERLMGRWSRLAGRTFLDWLALPKGLRWIDVGCGNGAFTEELIAHSAPARLPASIRRKDSSPMRAPGLARSLHSFRPATRRRCRSPTARSTPP